jgi:HSP20 family protein
MTTLEKSAKAPSVSTVEVFADRETFENSAQVRCAINIRETEHKYELELTAPGFRKDDFNITTYGGLLTISAEVKEEENENEDRYIRKEFLRSSFSRTFSLPENIIVDHISSEYHNGVLIVDLKKNNRFLIGKKHVKVD